MADHIATELNTCGVPTKRGGTWWHKQVRRILDRFDPEENVELMMRRSIHRGSPTEV